MSRIGHDPAWIRSSDVVADDEVMTVGPAGDHSQSDWSRITSKWNGRCDGIPDHVYDLTVEDAHSFIGNGFVVHNTAAAVKDEFGDGRWTLEAGALVLADKGLACIDELDKMTEQDRSSMHEAMESQRISVAKAGITATLQCRCSMLGAANPKYGRFDDNESLSDQINMPPALLSRFDLIFALTDKPKAENGHPDRRAHHHGTRARRGTPSRGPERAGRSGRRLQEDHGGHGQTEAGLRQGVPAEVRGALQTVRAGDEQGSAQDHPGQVSGDTQAGRGAGRLRTDHRPSAGGVHPAVRGIGPDKAEQRRRQGGRRACRPHRRVLPEQDGHGTRAAWTWTR